MTIWQLVLVNSPYILIASCYAFTGEKKKPVSERPSQDFIDAIDSLVPGGVK